MLGISTSSFYGQLSTEDAIYKIAEMGVGCAEVFLNSFSEYTGEYINMVSGRLKESGLAFNSVHTLPTQFEPQLFAISDRQRSDAVCFLRNVMEASAKNGCGIYVMHGKPYYKKNIEGRGINVSQIAEQLNIICDIAEEYGISIALENVHWAMCNNIEFINEVKAMVPKLMFTLDIKQAHLSRIALEEYIFAFGSRLINVHICDHIGNKTCLPGQGEVDFEGLRNNLDKIDYKGNIILEVYAEDYQDFDEIKNCVNLTKGIF